MPRLTYPFCTRRDTRLKAIEAAVRSRAERWAGYAVVLAIFFSACVALYETVVRLVNPQELEHL